MIIRLCFLRLSARGTFTGNGEIVDLMRFKPLRFGHGHYFYLWRDIPPGPARPNPLDYIFEVAESCFLLR